MPIRWEELPPQYREQAAQKALRAAKAAENRKKYNNQKVELLDIKFDSRAESRRFQQLMVMLKAGEIEDLRIHPEFTLVEAYTRTDGKRVRRMRYTADFSYHQGEKLVVEDVKSRPTARATDYQMRKKLMLDKYGIEVQEIT